MNEKDTYGTLLSAHYAKGLQMEDDVIEYRKEMEPQVIKDIENAVNAALSAPQYKNKDFYIVALFNVERIGSVPRCRVFARQSCPTPVYKQAVWKYHRVSGALEFLWVIPGSMRYYQILHNKNFFIHDKEMADITKFVVLMESGELLDWVKKENGEKIDAVIKINKEPLCIQMS